MYIPNKFNELQITTKQDVINQLIIYKSAADHIFLDKSSKRRIVISTARPLISVFQTDIEYINGSIVLGPNFTTQEGPHPDYFQLSNNSKIILSLNISPCTNSGCTSFTFTDNKDISFSPSRYSAQNPYIINYNANTIFYLTATSDNCKCPSF